MLQGLFASTAQAAGSAVQQGQQAADGSPALLADAGATLFADAGMGPSLAGPHGTDLYLDVTLNGMAAGLAHFGYRDGELWASAATLRQLGFVLPADAYDPVRLSDLPGVRVDYNASRQVVSITAPLSLLNLPTTVLGVPGIVGRKAAEASAGLLLNYDLYGTQGQGGSASLNAYTELRAFGGPIVFSSTALSQATRSGGSDWQGHSVRLDSTWSRSWPDDLVTLRLGDTLTSSLGWSRATRIGGMQLSRNFTLQPYTITTPAPALMGSAALPSDVELYINGIKQYSGAVPAGPFQLNTIPNISGAGNAQVVLTDAFGRATTLNFSLYNSQQLLKKGLSDWSVELGMVRQNYGLRSWDYGGDAAGSATYRRGLSGSLTVEAHGEATPGLATGGIGAAWQLGAAGVVSGSAANSNHNGLRGSQFGLGYDWRNDRLSFSLSGTGTRGSYLDVASLYGAPPPGGQGRALVGYSTESLGSFSLSYLYLRYAGQDATRYLNANWFKGLGRGASLGLSVNQNLVDRSQRSIFLTLNWMWDRSTAAAVSVEHDNGRRGSIYGLDASRTTPSDGGFGWRAGVRRGDDDRNGGTAELDYLGRYGKAALGVNDFAGERYAYGDVTGALVLMGGHAFAARHVDNAFAVVSTDGIPGVPVLLENRGVGKTDANGMLLVTPLNAYQNNKLAIDPMQLPPDVRIDTVKAIALPSDRAGTLVRFPITPVRSALISLVDGEGKPLPLGGRVQLNGRSDDSQLVGYDGAVYFDTLQEQGNTLSVRLPEGGTCLARFDYRKPADGSIPQIGPIACLGGRK